MGIHSIEDSTSNNIVHVMNEVEKFNTEYKPVWFAGFISYPLLCNKPPLTSKFKTTPVYYRTVSVGQGFEAGSRGWFCHEIAVRMLAGSAVVV